MGIVIRKRGAAIIVLRGAALADADRHIANGYPQYLGEWLSGVLTAEEYPDESLPPADPLPPPTPEELAAVEEESLKNAMIRGVATVLLRDYRSSFDQENRLRVLEGQPTRTLAQYAAHVSTLVSPTTDQFKQALKTILGL